MLLYAINKIIQYVAYYNSYILYYIYIYYIYRMRSLGMVPVLPGFAGQVPQGFDLLHPEAKFSRQLWQYFDSNYSGVYLLDPTEQLFVEVGKLFIEEQTKVMMMLYCMPPSPFRL